MTKLQLPLQHTEGFFSPGIAVDGPGSRARASAGDFEFATSAFAFEQARVAKVYKKVVASIHVAERMSASVTSDFRKETAGADVSYVIDETEPVTGVDDF